MRSRPICSTMFNNAQRVDAKLTQSSPIPLSIANLGHLTSADQRAIIAAAEGVAARACLTLPLSDLAPQRVLGATASPEPATHR